MSLPRSARGLRVMVERNWRWGRTHGWANLLEEHDLDPRVRLPRAVRRADWLLRHGVSARSSRAIFLVGAQRSGTNMITHGLNQAPEMDVYNEGNRRAFRDYHLRDLEHINNVIDRSRRPYVMFKPLCDSDRTGELLDQVDGQPARAVWAFRDVEGRVRSHVQKFGRTNLDAFLGLLAGVPSWQVRGLSEESVELIRSLNVPTMSPQTASALFWYVRNIQFYERGLDSRPDVRLADYGQFVRHPETSMRRLCTFLEFPYRPQLIAHVQPQVRTPKTPVVIDEQVRELCERLEERLQQTYLEQDDDPARMIDGS